MKIYMLTWWDNEYEPGKALPFATEAGAQAYAQERWMYPEEEAMSWMRETPFGDLRGMRDPEFPSMDFCIIAKMTLGD